MSEQENDLEKQLFSDEQIERTSPDLWPEKIPGVNDYSDPKSQNFQGTPKWMANLDEEDMEMLQELGCMSQEQVIEKVNAFANLSYSLGLDEAKEMTRGMFLNIFPPKGNKATSQKES